MQDYLDPKLIQRLLRPIEQPGVINTGMGWEIVRRSQQFTNRLPLLSHLTQRWNRKIGFHGEQIPIVYAQPQPQETPTTRSISAELSQFPSSQRMVVQAKFAPGSDRANKIVQNTNSLAGETPPPQDFLKTNTRTENFPSSQTTNAVSWVEATKPNNNYLTTNAIVEATKPNQNHPITNAVVEATKPNNNYPTTNAVIEATKSNNNHPTTNAVIEATKPNNNYPTTNAVIEATKPNNNYPTTNAVIEATKPNNNYPTTNAVIEATKPNNNYPTINAVGWVEATKPNNNYPTTNSVVEATKPNKSRVLGFAIAQPNLQNSIPYELETPLVFANSRVNTESVQTELKVPNPGTTGISKTEPMTQTTGLSREVSPNIQSDETLNLQSDRQDKANVQNPIDLEVLTDKIERKLMQRLIVESERRGRNIWS